MRLLQEKPIGDISISELCDFLGVGRASFYRNFERKDVILGLCGPKPEYTKEEAYASVYVAYTLYGWIEVWFQRGMLESAEEIADMFKIQGL